MLRLQMLGGIVVLDARGQAVSAATVHRRPAAILAALAVAGEHGLTRDKLVGLLWPEIDAARAGHSLAQALYSIRRSTGLNDLIFPSAPLRLNRDRITTDIDEMERTLAQGDLEGAVSLYGGPFLDGFYITAAPEFDQWMSVHRAAIESRIVQALETLAEQMERCDLHAKAANWRARQAAMRPLDSAVAARLIVALARSGDRGGALEYASAHEALLRDQLDLPLDPAVTKIVESLRVGSLTSSIHVQRPAASRTDSPLTPTTVGPANPSRHESRNSRRPRFTAASRLMRLGIGVALAAAVLAVVDSRLHLRPAVGAPSTASSATQSVVVIPFQVAGVNPSLSYLGAGLAELMALRLTDDSVARSPDIGVVLSAWQHAGFSAADGVARDSVLRFAQRLEVSRVVVGTVVGTRERLLLSATELAVPSGQRMAAATAQGPADSISALADRLAGDLLIAEAGEDEHFPASVRYPLSAVRRYVAGRAADRRGDYGAAASDYESALGKDSTFALAALDLARVETTEGEVDHADVALARAWSHRSSLGTLDLARLVAATGPNYPRPSTAVQQLEAWERVVRLAPARADGWTELGAHLVHDGPCLGLPSADAHAATALNHALTLDADHGSARELLAQLEMRGDSGAGRARSGQVGVVDGHQAPTLAPFLAWRASVAGGDSLARLRARVDLQPFNRATLRAIAMASQFDGIGLDDGLAAIRLLAARATTTDERVDAVLAEHSLLMNAGRPREALEATDRLGTLRPDSHAHLRLRMLDALYASGDAAAASAAARALAVPATPAFATFPLIGRQRMADACVLGQWQIAHADTTGLQAAIQLLRAGDPSRQAVLVSSSPIVCADLLEASLAVATKRGDALHLVNGLDSLVLTSTVSGNASSYIHIAVARLFNTLGFPERALTAIRKRPYMSGWPAYLAMTWRHESALAGLIGNAAAATAAYHRYLALRRGGTRDGGREVAVVRVSIPLVKEGGSPIDVRLRPP